VKLVEAVCERLKVPTECRDLAVLAAREHGCMHQLMQMRPDTVAKFLERLDVLRRPERAEQLIAVCLCDARGRTGLEEAAYPQAERLRTAMQAFCSVDAGAIARNAPDKARIPALIQAERLQAVQAILDKQK
jgi:tRNA nucleotidyltransferase (CCA-adding enzyme)